MDVSFEARDRPCPAARRSDEVGLVEGTPRQTGTAASESRSRKAR